MIQNFLNDLETDLFGYVRNTRIMRKKRSKNYNKLLEPNHSTNLLNSLCYKHRLPMIEIVADNNDFKHVNNLNNLTN